MTALQLPMSPIVKQLYERAMGVPQVGRACRDPLGVWDDFFEQLHLELTSLPTHDIIGLEDYDMDDDKAREEAEAEQYTACQQLRDAIAADLERLPAHDVFGVSNVQEKTWMHRLIQDLDRVLGGIPGEAHMEEVRSWLAGDDKWFLNDYVDDLVSKGT